MKENLRDINLPTCYHHKEAVSIDSFGLIYFEFCVWTIDFGFMME